MIHRAGSYNVANTEAIDEKEINITVVRLSRLSCDLENSIFLQSVREITFLKRLSSQFQVVSTTFAVNKYNGN